MATRKNNAKLFDPQLVNMVNSRSGNINNQVRDASLQADLRKQLRVQDEQDAIGSMVWYNCYPGIDGELIERILYYKGQGMFFQLNGRFFFLPFALNAPADNSGIDVYGRYTGISPLPFNGTTSTNEKGGKDVKFAFGGKIFIPRYEMADLEQFITEEGIKEEEIRQALNDTAVILRDYTPQFSQEIISRQALNDPLLNLMSQQFPMMNTALINGTGITGMRVSTEADAFNVYQANAQVKEAAVAGEKYVAITADVDLQELVGGGSKVQPSEYLLTFQALDNYRRGTHGIANNGVYQKGSHMLADEQQMNAGNIGLVLKNRVENRQKACAILNSYFGGTMWCEPSEVVTGIDKNGDMVLGSQEQHQPIQNEEGGMN